MKVILEVAGADAAALILISDAGPVVRALKSPEAGEPTVMTDIPVADAECLSAAIVNYVTRTRELLVLDDAGASRFHSDPYVRRAQPQSVLCAPIIHQRHLIGAIYLENTLVSGAFTPDRLEALNILISQTAISIQNATLFAAQEAQKKEIEQTNLVLQAEISERQRAERELTRYQDHLEELVEERTRELESAQSRLVEMSRQAGMAEVASGILHNVGNVLNSVNVGTSIAREQLEAMHVDGVAKLSSLLQEHSGDLAGFLMDDDRGRKIPEYLEKLGASLRVEHEQVLESLAAVGGHLEHMKNVIAAQQAYGRVATVTEQCLLQSIFETAIEISNAALQNRRIDIVREFEELPPMQVDRHQVLQIIVNLISNATQALQASSSDSRVITLKLSRDGGHVLLTVQDNGIGIKPEHMNKIFTHGFTTKTDGHGFGLHNCANAAQQMGGSISVHSDGEGKGATFVLRIPAVEVDHEARAAV